MSDKRNIQEVEMKAMQAAPKTYKILLASIRLSQQVVIKLATSFTFSNNIEPHIHTLTSDILYI